MRPKATLGFVLVAALVVSLAATASLAATKAQTKPDKITICHRTGSTTNPYVKIGVSGSVATASSVASKAVKAHLQHPADMVIAANVACPSTAPTPTPTAGHGGAQRTTLCHRTNSTKRPFVKITVSGAPMSGSTAASRAVRAHLQHEGDVVIAGTAACPTSPLAAPTGKGKGKGKGKK